MGIREIYDLSKSDGPKAAELGLEPDPLPPWSGFFLYHFISPLWKGCLGLTATCVYTPYSLLLRPTSSSAPASRFYTLPQHMPCWFLPQGLCSCCLPLQEYSLLFSTQSTPTQPSGSVPMTLLPGSLLGLFPPLNSLGLSPDQKGSATFPKCCYHLS